MAHETSNRMIWDGEDAGWRWGTDEDASELDDNRPITGARKLGGLPQWSAHALIASNII